MPFIYWIILMGVGIAMGVAFMAWALSGKDTEEEREEEYD